MSENSIQPWSAGAVIGLAVATFFVPLVGIIAGIVGLQQPATQGQGGALLAWGILATLMWVAMLGL